MSSIQNSLLVKENDKKNFHCIIIIKMSCYIFIIIYKRFFFSYLVCTIVWRKPNLLISSIVFVDEGQNVHQNRVNELFLALVVY